LNDDGTHAATMKRKLRGSTLAAPIRTRRFASAVVPWLLALLAFISAFAAHAQADEAVPVRVGRVANVQGTLYHSPDDNAGEWSPIGLNDPVAQGDNLWVDRGGRAEVDYGGGQVRLAGDTNLHVSRLTERRFALFVAAGSVIVRVRALEPEDSVRVDTPITQVALARPGLYRIDVDPEGARTTLIVREGAADVATAAGTGQVLPGQTAVLTGRGNVTADIRNGGGIDGFDTWSAARDRVYEQPRENAYVSREMVGSADLDTYGAWQTYPDYGAVWFPTVDPEWAPYRFGHWTWLRDWGYAWVDDAPWGYAPFHYGRWAYVGGRWGWCPGAYVARPLWAPALVAWYDGAGFTRAPGHNGVIYGWVPLGWREPFVPSWRGCASRCYARYNRPYAVNVAERPDARSMHFANWSVPGGVTAVPAAALASGRPVAINRLPIATNLAIVPSLSMTPPAVKPARTGAGAVRPGGGIPAPASSYAARVPIPSGSLRGRAASLPTAPPRDSTLAPAQLPGSAATRPIAPIERPRVTPLPAPVQSIERPVRTPASVPAPMRVPAPMPAPALPYLAPAPAIPMAPRAVPAPMPALALPHVAPAPAMPAAPAIVPVPPAPAAVPAPTPAQHAPVRIAPVAPPERPN
jgi:hypothetical protein